MGVNARDLVDLASTIIGWSGRLVLSIKESPGIKLHLFFSNKSGVLAVWSGIFLLVWFK